jgi:hypothetical protein
MCVLVQVAHAGSSGAIDQFYVLAWRDLCRAVVGHHKKYLAKDGNIRPRKRSRSDFRRAAFRSLWYDELGTMGNAIGYAEH